MILSVLIGGYEIFKFDNSVISEAFYTTSSKSDRNTPDSVDSAARDLRQEMQLRGQLSYSYRDYILGLML